MTVRLLHTADWQLGKPFGSIPGDAGALLREARFEAVRRLARIAAERRVDAVLVAGDAFDGNQVDDATIHRGLQAMSGYGGPWLLLPGNHDAHLAECVWTRLERLDRPANLRLHVLTKPETLPLLDGRLVVLPAPLTARHTRDDLTAWMDGVATPAAALRVGLAHGTVEGRLPDAADAANPIAPDRAERARLDYLALGDWHGALEIAPRTWYAGTPEPDRFRANEPGHVLLVELDEPGVAPRVERVAVASFRWSTLELRLSPEDDPAGMVERALADVTSPERVLVELSLAGEVGLTARAALDQAIERWAARLAHLRLDDRLRLAARPEDLGRIDDGGVIGAAARRLVELASHGAGEDRADAALALRHLWQALGRVPTA